MPAEISDSYLEGIMALADSIGMVKGSRRNVRASLPKRVSDAVIANTYGIDSQIAMCAVATRKAETHIMELGGRYATVEEYNEWLETYLKLGGTIDVYHDYPMPLNAFFFFANPSWLDLHTAFEYSLPINVLASPNYNLKSHPFKGSNNIDCMVSFFGWAPTSEGNLSPAISGNNTVHVWSDTVDKVLMREDAEDAALSARLRAMYDEWHDESTLGNIDGQMRAHYMSGAGSPLVQALRESVGTVFSEPATSSDYAEWLQDYANYLDSTGGKPSDSSHGNLVRSEPYATLVYMNGFNLDARAFVRVYKFALPFSVLPWAYDTECFLLLDKGIDAVEYADNIARMQARYGFSNPHIIVFGWDAKGVPVVINGIAPIYRECLDAPSRATIMTAFDKDVWASYS